MRLRSSLTYKNITDKIVPEITKKENRFFEKRRLLR